MKKYESMLEKASGRWINRKVASKPSLAAFHGSWAHEKWLQAYDYDQWLTRHAKCVTSMPPEGWYKAYCSELIRYQFAIWG